MPNQFIGNHSLYFYAQKATVSGTVALKATVPDTMALEKIHERFNDCFGVQERHRYNVYAANKKFNTDTQKGFARNFK